MHVSESPKNLKRKAKSEIISFLVNKSSNSIGHLILFNRVYLLTLLLSPALILFIHMATRAYVVS